MLNRPTAISSSLAQEMISRIAGCCPPGTVPALIIEVVVLRHINYRWSCFVFLEGEVPA